MPARARVRALARIACQGAVVCKGFYPPLDGNCASRRLTGLIRPARVANGTCLWAPTAGRQTDDGRTRRF
ncbi:hypothetical protein VNO78_39023 [Psophocarpus tetragonolobus]|uniref:Uncharacterized protein n=1 Tax=Psophocarpus tetragonolobus TaxID=3891 RepID=A0AAN9N3S2_PSOTE